MNSTAWRQFHLWSMILLTFLTGTIMATAGQPNILILLADDISPTSIGCYGSKNPGTTPHIDRLAAQGLRFTNMYVSEAICAPARAELYTGLYPHNNGVTRNHQATKRGTKSVVHYLSRLGYRVGLAGKTHYKPSSVYPFEYIHGFTRDCNEPNTGLGDWEQVKDFMKRSADEPFCLFICSSHAHAPWDSGDASRWELDALKLPPHLADTKDTRHYFREFLAEVRMFDDQVGIAMDFLEAEGLADNTIVIVLDENGTGMPGGKWTCYEWGCHSACIIRWPARIQPNQVTDAVAMYSDILPTLIEVAGGTPPASLDGRSLLALFDHPARAHREYAYLTYDTVGEKDNEEEYPIRAITDGTHKLILNRNWEGINYVTVINGYENGWVDKRFPTNRHVRLLYQSWKAAAETKPELQVFIDRHRKRPKLELYKLSDDPWEMKNLADNPEQEQLLKSLKEQLAEWCKTQGDTIPLEHLTEQADALESK